MENEKKITTAPGANRPVNYRYNFINRNGNNVGRLDLLISLDETPKLAHSLQQFFDGEGVDVIIVGGVAPVNPELAEISQKLDRLIEIESGKRSEKEKK